MSARKPEPPKAASLSFSEAWKLRKSHQTHGTWSQRLASNAKRYDLGSSSLYQLQEIFAGSNKIGVIVGAGPSLDKNIHHLRHVNARVVIVATQAALRSLERVNVRPHFTVVAEETPIVARYLEGVDSRHMRLVASSTTAPDFLYNWRGRMWFYHNATERLQASRWDDAQDRFYPSVVFPGVPAIDPIAPNITFHTLAVSRFMGIKVNALIGADFEVKDTKKHHSSSYPKGMKAPHFSEATMIAAMRRNFEKSISAAANQLSRSGIYNCTEGGALSFYPRMELTRFLRINRLLT